MIKRVINKVKREALPYFTFNKKQKFSECNIPFADFETVIIFETSFGWDSIMMQRPQQLAMGFGKENLVIYHSAKDKYDDKHYFKKLAENLYVMNLDIYRNLIFDACRNYPERYVVFYSTDPVKSKKISLYEKSGFRTIYEYVDDINPTLCSPRVYKKLCCNFEHMMQTRTKTVCTASRLYGIASKRTDSLLNTNACDYDHFSRKDLLIPDEMKRFTSKPVLGYYGALAGWFDYELIKKLADTGKYEIVLIGISYDGSLEESGITDLPSVHYLGKKDYSVLPAYASAMTVCMIPFIKNDLTSSTSPVKLFEYMALEKPIVTTDLDECRKYSSVFVAKDHGQFCALAEKAVSLAEDENMKAALRKEALDNTWQAKCSEILSFMRAR